MYIPYENSSEEICMFNPSKVQWAIQERKSGSENFKYQVYLFKLGYAIQKYGMRVFEDVS
jgi:hypothetical protein